MAVPATVGNGVYGLADATASVVYLTDVSMTMSTQQAFCKDHQGEDNGMTVFNEATTYTANYLMKTPDTHLAALGASTTFANDGIIHTPSAQATNCIVTGLASTRSATDYQRGTLTALNRPAFP